MPYWGGIAGSDGICNLAFIKGEGAKVYVNFPATFADFDDGLEAGITSGLLYTSWVMTEKVYVFPKENELEVLEQKGQLVRSFAVNTVASLSLRRVTWLKCPLRTGRKYQRKDCKGARKIQNSLFLGNKNVEDKISFD